MTRSILAAACAVFGLGASLPASQPTVPERLSQLPAGSMLDIRTFDQKHFAARLVEVQTAGVRVEVARGKRIEARDLRYEEIRSVKLLACRGSWHYVGRAALIAGVAMGAVAVALLIFYTHFYGS
jgi:hypothetical protein